MTLQERLRLQMCCGHSEDCRDSYDGKCGPERRKINMTAVLAQRREAADALDAQEKRIKELEGIIMRLRFTSASAALKEGS